jgi:hypothetical protein
MLQEFFSRGALVLAVLMTAYPPSAGSANSPSSATATALQTEHDCSVSRCCWHHVAIESDPSGAHVYGNDGLDWGPTGTGVNRIFWRYPQQNEYQGGGINCFVRSNYTVTLKKSGYKTTYHTWSRQYYGSRDEATRNTAKITVVLDTP